MRNCNVTLGNLKSLKTPIGRLLQIELLVIFTTFLFLLLVAFSSWRRRSNSKKFQLFIFVACTLSTFLLTYVLSLMHDAPLRNELFPFWAMLLMIAFESTGSISAYSLKDNEQWKRNNSKLLIKSIWLIWLMDLYFRDGYKVVVAAECLFIVLAVKFYKRAWAMMAASRRSLERSTKVLADYMKRKHNSEGVSLGEVNPVSIRGYTYLVWGEEGSILRLVIGRIHSFLRRVGINVVAEKPDYQVPLDEAQLITIEKVWNCGGRLLSSNEDTHKKPGDPQNKLKDMCLSFALFKLLRLRYASYSLPQEAHENAWKLICDGLLSQADGYERAFRVVEVELTFLFDFFYTKYGIIFQPGWLLIELMELMGIAMGIWATTSLLKHHNRPNSNCRLTTMPNGLSVDIVVTSVMIISFIIMELMQFFFMCFSEWAKVLWIGKYVLKKSWQGNVWIEKMIEVICGVQLLKPWEQKLHQYSFLKSYFYKSSWLLNNAIMAVFVDQTRDGQKQGSSIKLPIEVKEAVLGALKGNYSRKLDNGLTSLRKHNVFELSWACQLETQTQVILVWHIATSFCEQRKSEGLDLTGCTNFLVATSLSKYLAYLVAFAPWLLPDRPLFAEYEFNLAIIEAKKFFRGCKGMENQLEKMEKEYDGSSMHEETVIKRGSRLGNRLVNGINGIGDEEMIWKILADFWVELMLYVAPSDNVKAHAEHLAKGGEFVTHLWALLFHVGFERKPSY